MTTPQLHYTVRCYNDDGLYGNYTEAGYFNKICTAFQKLLEVKRTDLFIFFFFVYNFLYR
jgi:phosphoacetylglucosamine mutase